MYHVPGRKFCTQVKCIIINWKLDLVTVSLVTATGGALQTLRISSISPIRQPHPKRQAINDSRLKGGKESWPITNKNKSMVGHNNSKSKCKISLYYTSFVFFTSTTAPPQSIPCCYEKLTTCAKVLGFKHVDVHVATRPNCNEVGAMCRQGSTMHRPQVTNPQKWTRHTR